MKKYEKKSWIIIDILLGIGLICLLLSLNSCAATQKNIITPKEEIKITLRDSVVIKDSIRIVPIEVVKEISPQYDTLIMETSLAKSKSWIDTANKSLRGEIINKQQKQQRERIEIRYIEKTDTIKIVEPMPYPEPEPYVPKIYKYSMGFSIIVIVVLGLLIFLKIKRWF